MHQPFQLVDVLPTLLEATGSTFPEADVPPLEGRSMLPAWRGGTVADADLYWEHCGNAAVRRGHWKLVRAYPDPWELYDLENDRTELHDVAAEHPSIVDDLSAAWDEWASHVGLIPFETTVGIYRDMDIEERRAIAIASAEDRV